MITIEQAIMIFLENVPNKKIIGICESGGMYLFSSRDRKLKPDEDNWDCTMETVNKKTGKFSNEMSWFEDFDLVENAKELLNQEQVEELISSLTFDK